MKNTSKLLAVILAFTIALSGIVITTLTAGAAAVDLPENPAADGVYATFKGSDFSNNSGYDVAEHSTADGRLLLDGVNGKEFWGLYANSIKSGTVYKVGYYFTITGTKDGSGGTLGADTYGWTFRVFHRGDYYIAKENREIFGEDALKNASEENPLKVVVVLVTYGTNGEFCTLPEGLVGSIDKVVIADADYNFATQNDGYTVTYENIANAGGGAAGAPAASSWKSSNPNLLSFNLRAVNLLSGASAVSASSELTLQYTDASLGDNLELYVQIAKKDGTVLVEKQQVGNGFLRVESQSGLYVDDQNTDVTKDVYSNMAGAVTFSPNLSGSYSASDLQVTAWIENSANPNSFSGKATVEINNAFSSGTPSGLTGSNWMSYIDGATLLSQINLPGSHDSGSQYFSSLSNYNKCQDSDISAQLTYGVRYLDIRGDTKGTWQEITLEGKTVQNFGISHSSYAALFGSTRGVQLTFDVIYGWCKEFLAANPSETILLVVNDENCEDKTIGDRTYGGREALMYAVLTFVNANPDLFYTKTNEIPTLDDVRGKIVLIRRFPGDYAGDNGGMDFFCQLNSNGTVHPIIPVSSSIAVTTYTVQDQFQATTSNKSKAALAFLDTAKENKKANQYYINGYNGTGGSYITTGGYPSNVANTVNKNFSNKTLTKGAQYGYQLFDFITAAICQKVYETNIFTSAPQNTAANNEKSNDKVMHYDFADISDNIVADLENNGFDGALNNSGSLQVSSIYNTVTFNNQAKQGDLAGYISVPQSVFRGTGDTATIQVWIKDTGNNARDTWLSIGRNSSGIGNNYFVANTKWDGKGPRYAVKTTKVASGGIEIAEAASDPTAQTWHLLTYVLNGENLKIYVDGNSTAVVDAKANANFSDLYGSTVNSPIRLGAASYWLGDDSFIGSMGDFIIYNYAVSANEIADTYKALAEEYTYILKATLNGTIDAVAGENAADTYIDEKYTDTGSTIWFTVPSGSDLTAVKLALEIDGSKVEISENGGAYVAFDASASYDLSQNLTLRVTSLNGTRTKEYNVKVNGILVKDYATDALVAVYPAAEDLPALERDGYLAIGYYDSAKESLITEVSAGDTVYQRLIEIEAPVHTGKSIRIATDGTNGLRFKATINRGDFYNYFNNGNDYVYSENSDFTFGMLILPEDMLNGGELTKDTANVLDIIGENVYSQDENVVEYTGVLIGISKKNYARNMVARAYITYTFRGETYTVYSEQAAVGSYLSVAKQVYNDPAISSETKASLESIFGAEVLTQ